MPIAESQPKENYAKNGQEASTFREQIKFQIDYESQKWW